MKGSGLKVYVICLIVSFLISTTLCFLLIKLLKKKKTGQPIYKYVTEHKGKEGTPTMGGLSFIISAIICSIIFCFYYDNLFFLILAIGFAYMLVGLIDDSIKLRFKTNEGLKPYQKIIFQFSIALVAGFYVYNNNLDLFFIPFTKKYVDIGYYSIIIVVFVFLAITNSVNLTDGIDGLASTVSLVYLVFLSLIIFFENQILQNRNVSFYNESNFYIICISLIGSLLGFLIFNTNKAQVFMGDTGSLSLGGFIGALSIFSLNCFYILILGIMFVVSSISVIIQVLYYKRAKKRVFLMAPYHHHLQHKGLSETKICYIYLIISLLFGLISLIGFM